MMLRRSLRGLGRGPRPTRYRLRGAGPAPQQPRPVAGGPVDESDPPAVGQVDRRHHPVAVHAVQGPVILIPPHSPRTYVPAPAGVEGYDTARRCTTCGTVLAPPITTRQHGRCAACRATQGAA